MIFGRWAKQCIKTGQKHVRYFGDRRLTGILEEFDVPGVKKSKRTLIDTAIFDKLAPQYEESGFTKIEHGKANRGSD